MVKQTFPAATSSTCSLCNATAFRKASRRLTQFYDEALASSGLRSTQLAVLAALEQWQAPAPSLAELAQSLVMDRSSLGHTLRPLKRDGLILLQEGDEDRRQRHIVLTVPGKAKLRQAKQLWLAAQERFDAIFGKAEAAHLRATLLAIANEERLGQLDE